jgi:hypothetical protein
LANFASLTVRKNGGLKLALVGGTVSASMDGSIYSGDELGTLWKIDLDGNSTALATFEGKIRHAPQMTQAGLLVHVQSSTSSTVYILDPVTGEEHQQFPAGPSPAMPVLNGKYAAVADSINLQMLKCDTMCTVVSQIPFHSNGEIGMAEREPSYRPTQYARIRLGFVPI